MPNKTVPSYTQVPVTGQEILSVHYDRLPAAQMSIQVIYEIKDSLTAVRGTRSTTSTLALASYPLSAAATIALCNAAEGT
jgi:hypothetical protein